MPVTARVHTDAIMKVGINTLPSANTSTLTHINASIQNNACIGLAYHFWVLHTFVLLFTIKIIFFHKFRTGLNLKFNFRIRIRIGFRVRVRIGTGVHSFLFNLLLKKSKVHFVTAECAKEITTVYHFLGTFLQT